MRSAVLLSALLEQPRLAHRRSQVRHDLRRERRSRNSARPICWRIAAICMRRWPAPCPRNCVRLNHKLVGLDEIGRRRAPDLCRWRDGDRRCRGRRRRRAFRRCATSCSTRAPVNFTGRIAYRTTYPAALLNGETIDDCTKWWGEDRHIVIYYVKPDRSEIYLVTSQPEPEFRIESWSAKGDVKELRKAFAGFDRQVEQVLAACPDVHKWAIVDRDSLERWADGKVDAARRCLPSDDALHGAGRGDGDRGCRRAVALPRRRRSRRHRRCLPPLRGDAQGAHVARAGRPRAPTHGCAARPMRTGSMAMMPGPCRSRRELIRHPAPPAARLRRCRPSCWR